MKCPFNTYTNQKGQTLPKSPVIQSSSKLFEWLKNNYSFPWTNAGKLIDESKPYILIGVSASHQGYVYIHISTCNDREISMCDPSTIKDFTNEEAFKRYLNWVRKYPKKLVYQKFE